MEMKISINKPLKRPIRDDDSDNEISSCKIKNPKV